MTAPFNDSRESLNSDPFCTSLVSSQSCPMCVPVVLPCAHLPVFEILALRYDWPHLDPFKAHLMSYFKREDKKKESQRQEFIAGCLRLI